MVVDAEVPRNRADADAAVLHRSSLRRDQLVDRDRQWVANVDVGQNASEVS